jgi:hypothetical protein
VVPAERIELPTNGLQNRCSTAELRRQMKYLQCVTKVKPRPLRGGVHVGVHAGAGRVSCTMRCTLRLGPVFS